ncbi:ER degradation-enhancing alpha-mannosidase-like protein 3 [Halyomorpha halys]|uniref:ER degradation-enhancing alpha-mannosidase-like protein 3 n=1 Tax=Halyomorpha halys TaxID=286706 RepID=UPI0006D516C2|nr:ER degradation-enhancing alpha-mannosidase-like protein 3 [Halyomorpha halys]XP_014292371.1 ER degradation-enhancing alpha-mannosidase-like protein 3 [Halyomorpha halys]XP_014292372.1 ER degradation-enhancing alpha-mannosidase-like protein 3 [Halyomorpha halys]
MTPYKFMWCFCYISSLLVIVYCIEDDQIVPMTDLERERLKEEARDMFYHAYRAYMDNAYPADELMPLSCEGRYRGSHPSRGDLDDTLGNFSLSLIDTLDTLVVLGDIAEFEHAVKLVIKDVTFDSDVTVSVFETNIRVLGGLLSAHILAEYVKDRIGVMQWYRGELLEMAKDIGYRLLPAFNTTTGIPQARVNLRHGIKTAKLWNSRETCTACAGTMLLEMAALSRLTGDTVFEEKADKGMDSLWGLRHRGSGLMGAVLDVESGRWVRRESGVGAGIDSYYEYCLKAYILLGNSKYLSRFNKHYSAVMKYVSQGPMLLDVHMHRPHTNARNFMDALLAFWPGLQVLSGDLKPAVETHEMLYQVMQRHTFIPEAFTTDFQVHWGEYPLRPEFLESTYFLYRATGDHHYLRVGEKILRGLQTHTRVPCGYAALSDVRSGRHDDRMDSYVLAETFKYLYLLFAEPSDLIIDLDDFLFTTEAHLLPLSLSRIVTNHSLGAHNEGIENEDGPYQCPSSLRLFPQALRKPLKNFVSDTCPDSVKQVVRRRLLAANFQSGNPEHMRIIGDMGISITHLDDGRIQLLHTFSKARNVADAKEGLLFMQEMLEVAKSQGPETLPQAVTFISEGMTYSLSAGPAHFGRQLVGNSKVTGKVGIADPLNACEKLKNPEAIKGKIAIVQRGNCMFIDKARRMMEAGAIGGIVVDNSGDVSKTSPLFAMSGDGNDDVNIPVVFLFVNDAAKLLSALTKDLKMKVTLGYRNAVSEEENLKKKEDLDNTSENKGSIHNFSSERLLNGEGEIIEVKNGEIDSTEADNKKKKTWTENEEDLSSLPEKLQNVLASLSKAAPSD